MYKLILILSLMLFSAKGYSNDSIQYIKSEADSAYIQNQYERAVELYLQLANECKNDAQLYYNLGCAYLKINKPRNAKWEFFKAIDLNNQEPDFYYNLAYTYKILKNDKQAKIYLDLYDKLLEQQQ